MSLPPFVLERYFARYEFDVPFLLGSSDCESMTIGELLAFGSGKQNDPSAGQLFNDLSLGYTESAGHPELRAEIARIYETVDASDVLVHSGAEEAIYTFMHATLSPGDHVVAHAPAYQSLHSIAASIGVEVTSWRAREEEGWALDPDELAASLRPTTRVVVLNCPHNPTGYLMDRERFDVVVEIVRRHGAWLFSDEVYRELEYRDDDRLPAACDVYERAVSLGVMSKTYGLPGLRIGWLASRDRDVLTRVAEIKDYLTICASAPSEFLATVALRQRLALADRSRELVLANLEHADAFFARWSGRFTWRRPDAGPIAFVRLREGGSGAFAKRVAEEAGVMLVPSTVYDAGDEHLRFGFGRQNCRQALDRLDAYLATG
ncbi:MAG: aminotransferase class I/II-fold pyridoxal phosphate-dependent enzyme [Acidobacteriota bacterium]